MAQAAKQLKKIKDIEAQALQEQKEKEESNRKRRNRSRDRKKKVRKEAAAAGGGALLPGRGARRARCAAGGARGSRGSGARGWGRSAPWTEAGGQLYSGTNFFTPGDGGLRAGPLGFAGERLGFRAQLGPALTLRHESTLSNRVSPDVGVGGRGARGAALAPPFCHPG